MEISANHYESSDDAIVKVKDIIDMDCSIPELDTSSEKDGFGILSKHMEKARTYWLCAGDTCYLDELRTAATKAVIELLRGLELTARGRTGAD